VKVVIQQATLERRKILARPVDRSVNAFFSRLLKERTLYSLSVARDEVP
jgi:hypothetical protein